jgi:hypothetical protein
MFASLSWILRSGLARFLQSENQWRSHTYCDIWDVGLCACIEKAQLNGMERVGWRKMTEAGSGEFRWRKTFAMLTGARPTSISRRQNCGLISLRLFCQRWQSTQNTQTPAKWAAVAIFHCNAVCTTISLLLLRWRLRTMPSTVLRRLKTVSHFRTLIRCDSDSNTTHPLHMATQPNREIQLLIALLESSLSIQWYQCYQN